MQYLNFDIQRILFHTMKHDRVYPVSKTQKSRKQIAYLFFLCKYTQNIQDILYINDLTIF
nr:MAG TPA: hypothetical protein [Caudoviricetes sp.]